MGLIERKATVANRLGLHARPAAELVKVANRFTAGIELAKDGMWVNAKSILGVMTLAAERGSELAIKADGPDAEAAVDAVAAVVQRDWGQQDV
jgi:phosphotransferase system HPr (HPr) family protein